MTIEGVPWMVAGGLHSAEVGRSLAFAATNGATGVVLPGDFKVSALPTPGAAVRIAPGSACIASEFPGADGQSYIVRGVGSTDVPVAKAGNSVTTRYVILRITDPAYPGQPLPSDPTVGPYAVPDVVSSITNLSYPFVVLARLSMAADSTSVTKTMITDMREVANPRYTSLVEMGIPPQGETLNHTADAPFPSFRPTIKVPEWASTVSIVATISAIASTGNAYGEMAVTLGAAGANQVRSANALFDVDTAGGSEQRHTFTIGGKAAVPAAFRGTNQVLGTDFRHNDGPGRLVTRRGTQVLFQVSFFESAV